MLEFNFIIYVKRKLHVLRETRDKYRCIASSINTQVHLKIRDNLLYKVMSGVPFSSFNLALGR